MRVQGISLGNYRNYRELHIEFHPNLNIIVGGNAQGKTNILEAIFYAATGKSHRTNYDQDLIAWGEKIFRIAIIAERNSGKIKVEILARSDGKKMLKVNNQLKKKLSELIGNLNVVMFSPEDMMLVKGGPSVRRRFLDIEISQISPFYCHNLANYNKVLSQRNNLLKAIREDKEKLDLLDVWDAQLVKYGTQIIKKRSEVIKRIERIAKEIHSQITEGREELNIFYAPSVDLQKKVSNNSSEEYYFERLKENRKAEIIKGATLLGPHRDDIDIKIGDTSTKSFGSQGQQRTCALSMKLSEIEFMKVETGEYPILLLDDVMSELDTARRRFLLEVVKGKVQTFVTSTEIQEFPEIVKKKSAVFIVEAGKISKTQEG